MGQGKKSEVSAFFGRFYFKPSLTPYPIRFSPILNYLTKIITKSKPRPNNRLAKSLFELNCVRMHVTVGFCFIMFCPFFEDVKYMLLLLLYYTILLML